MILASFLRSLLVLALLHGKPFDAAQAPGLPRHHPLGLIKELDADSWGPVRSADGRTFRTALGGKAEWLRIPGWWGDSIRPPRGAPYIIEVTYKDTVEQPVIAEV